jgi:hypothetical protein
VREPPRAQGPIQLRVSYTSPKSLVAEFTRNVGRRSVVLHSRRPAAPGTRFFFELVAEGVADKVEVLGEVVSCDPRPGTPGRFEVGVRYDAGADRRGLDRALEHIIEAHLRDQRSREHPRIPIHILASGDRPASPQYLVRDLSRGGAGVEVESGEPPPSLQAGAPFLLELGPAGKPALLLHGEVVWRTRPLPGRSRVVNPAFGVRFGTLRPDMVAALESMLTLRGLPPPPWNARLSLGMDAISRMP